MTPELEDQQLWQEHQDTVRVMAELGIDLEQQSQQEFFRQRQQQRNLELVARLCEVPLEWSGGDGSVFYWYKFRDGEFRGALQWQLGDEYYYVPRRHYSAFCRETNQITGLRGTIQNCGNYGWHWHWPIHARSFTELQEIVETLDNLPVTAIEAVGEKYAQPRR